MQEAQAKSNGLSSVQEEFQELKDEMGSIGGTADIDGKKCFVAFPISPCALCSVNYCFKSS